MAMDRVWKRAAQGRHTALVGGLPPEPPSDSGIYVLRIPCDGPERPLGPILEARARAERILGERTPLLDLAADRVRSGLRRRLLGDETEADAPGAVVSLLNKLARDSERKVVLVFDAVELADASTVELLREIVARKGWLTLPLVLGIRTPKPTGRAAELLRVLAQSDGPEAIVHLDSEPAADPLDGALDPEALAALPADVRLTLRAAAHVGSLFEVHLVGSVLGVSDLVVLERLQMAADAGFVLEDRGDGRIRLPDAAAESLRRSTLASLARRWHQAFATLLAAPVASAGFAGGAEDEASIADASEHGGEPDEAPTDGRGSHARAARHLVAAGDYDGAAARFLDAAREARRVGAGAEALAFARNALGLVVQLPATAAGRRLRVQILAETGRLQWESHGPGADFTLTGALQSIDQAAALVQDGDPPSLRAELAALTAAICYDIGDEAHLERALSELVRSSRDLQAAGDSLGAARLLNEQAAVLVRKGDAKRATHQLQQSRRVFASRAETDPSARLELAETDHLLARLPLHTPAGPPMEDETWRAAIDHAQSAEQAYRKLGMPRDRARVWETLGRLELRAGHPDAAAELLTRAVEEQQRTGDVMGLARSSAALADVLTSKDRHYEALAVLGESVELNLEKGSVKGLSFNREALQALQARLNPQQRLDLSYEIRRVEQRLAAAEATLTSGVPHKFGA